MELIGLIVAIIGLVFTFYQVLYGGNGIVENRKEKKKRLELSKKVNEICVESQTISNELISYLPKVHCIGRKELINDIIESVQKINTLIVLVGEVGSGKTTIGKAVGNKLFEMAKNDSNPKFKSFLWIDSRYDRITYNDFLNKIGVQLGFPNVALESGHGKVVAIHKALNKFPSLIILDNLKINENDRNNINNILKFLQNLPEGSNSIITTRYLNLSKGKIMKIGNFTKKESIEFIRNEAENKELHFISNLNKDDILEIHKCTDGSPLAIEWVMGQIYGGRNLPSVLLDIKTGNSDIYETLFGGAWKLLSKEEKILLLDLTVARTSFSTDAMIFISKYSKEVTTKAISRLISFMFFDVEYRSNGSYVRYYLHPLTHLFTINHADEFPNELLQAHELAIKYYIEFIKSQGEDAKKIELEIENIFYLISWCKTNEKWELIIELMDAIYDILLSLGYFEERAELGLLAAIGAERIGQLDRKAHYLTLACIYPLIGEYTKAREMLLEALSIAQPFGNGLEIAVIKKSLAYNYFRQGKLKIAYKELKGVDLLAEKFEEYDAIPNNHIDILALKGAIEYYLELYDDALKTQIIMLNKCRDIGWQRAVAYPLRDIAEIEMVKKEYVSARKNLENAYNISQEYSDKRQAARIQFSIAKLLFRTGLINESKLRISQAKAVFDKLGMINESKESTAFLSYINQKPTIYWKFFKSYLKHKHVYAIDFPVGGD